MQPGVYKIIACCCCWLVLATTVAAQSTRVRGRVSDAVTGEALRFVSVVFPGTTTGTTTDDAGVYSLETRDTVSRLQATYVGYAPQTKTLAQGSYNQVDFALDPVEFGIGDVVITPGANPALPILAGVLRFKSRNDPEELERFSCATYTKMELDLTNVKPRFRNRKLQKNFGFVFEHIDTSALTGETFLPVMISETNADYYHSRRPAVTREVIRANRISGVENNSSVAQFTGHLHGNVNFYDNFIDLFDVRFAGPLSSMGQTFYDYYLIDSTRIDGRKTYKIRFHPKGLSVPVLDGEINIDSATYGLQSAYAKMAKGVNVNWIRHLSLENVNQLIRDSVWFRRRDRVTADFSISQADSSKLTSFLGSREVCYSDVRIGDPLPQEVLKMDNNVIVQGEEIVRNDEAYWESVRPYRLSEKEKGIYSMVDSIQQVPLYRNIYTFINTILVGYWNTEYIGFGPYYKLASFNRLEGFRMQLGVRTTSKFSRRIRLSGYAAYGTRDERVKGGGAVELALHRQLTRKLTVSGKHDVMQLGAGNNALTESNILSSLLSRGGRQRMSMVNELDIRYEHEWRHGISHMLGFQLRRIDANRFVPMIRPDGSYMASVADCALHAGLRLSKNENIYRMPFDKQSMGSPYPILTLGFTAGIKGLLRNDYEYYRLEGGIHYKLELPPAGDSHITVNGGKIFGKIPYLLLKLHEGNGTYFYDPYAFSCMNFYEFASDAWVSFFYEHHFNGFLLGKIPLIRRLKWREVLVFKGVYGTLTPKNDGSLPNTAACLLFPRGMSSVSHPYLETGFGVENIFRLLRVDCIWRLTHRTPEPGQEVQNFAVNLSLKLKF